jgi:hypothetical protein
VNDTNEPLLENETTRAVIAELQSDGTLEVADAGSADTVLRVRLTSFALQPVRYERDRVKAASEYRVRIGAEMMFGLRGADTPLMRRRVAGEHTFELTSDLVSSKRAALPEVARDLAHNIVERVVEYW